jgi:signal transduction histidine kinase
LSPSLANRLRIGFAIGFAVLTAMAVIGVGRFIQQRQDFEDAIARSYQVEMAARVQLARGANPDAARSAVTAQAERRQELRDQISSDTRDTALLVAAGLIAGLTGAVLLFSGLIASMRRPLEELVEASGRLAAGDRSARVEVGGLSETATLGAAFNEMAGQLEIEASQRDQLDRLKDEFVLTASHELRSPLTSVQGFAEILMLDRDSLTPKQADTVEIILDNCRHLVRLLNDLLDLARSDAGRLAITPRPTELAPLIDDAVRTMRAQTDGASQTLAQRIEPGLPPVNVEADRIRQILVNFLTNAHEYSPEGASIEVTARVVDDDVEIAVTDNGPGIPESQLEHIFQRFTRGDAGLTQRVGGTGLGLAISKSLVELHGGTIAVDSAVGVGSTFSFRLPATTAAKAS